MNKSPQAKARAKKEPERPITCSDFSWLAIERIPKTLANLRNLCQKHLKRRYTIETVDVVQNFEAAVRDNILVTPALVLVTPLPRVVILGNLSDLPSVLAALRVSEGDS